MFQYIGYILGYLLFGFIIAYILNAYIDFWDKKLFKDLLNNNKNLKGIMHDYCIHDLLWNTKLLIFTLVPALTTTLKDFAVKIPTLIDKVVAYYNNLLDGTNYELSEDVLKSVTNALDSLLKSATDAININLITSIVSNATSLLFNFIMGIMVSVYMLIEKEHTLVAINRVIDGLFRKRTGERLRWIGHEVNQIFRKYFTGKLLQALICTILAYVAFSIARLPYAILFAVTFGITNMIPYIGPWIGAIPIIIISLAYDFWLGVAAAICILIIQAVDNWFISPKIVGGKMGISPLLVLAGLGIGGRLFGLPGLIFGDVLAAIFKLFFYDVYIRKRIEAKQLISPVNEIQEEKEDAESEVVEEEVVTETEETVSIKTKMETRWVSIKEKLRKVFKRK